MNLLEKPEQEDVSWFRFPYSSPNRLMKKGEKAYHGTHLECLRGIMATGRILPSSSVIEGARHFEGRPGVYLHKETNRHLAAGYASLTRYGPKHVFMRAMLEVMYDVEGSQKKGKQTNQLILAYDSVQITAVLVQIVTKQHMQLGEYLREWSGGLEVPLESTKEAFVSLGLEKTWHQDVARKLPIADTSGDTPLTKKQGGVAPPGSSLEEVPSGASPSTHGKDDGAPRHSAKGQNAAEDIQHWMGDVGCLGAFRDASTNPRSSFATSVSKALSASLRHGHRPHIAITPAGWARVVDLLEWPRIRDAEATAGDIMEVVRSNEKGRFEMGRSATDGCRYVRAVRRP